MTDTLQWDLTRLIEHEKYIPRLRAAQTKAVESFVAARAADDSWQHDQAKLKVALDEFATLAGTYGASGTEDYYWSLRQALNQNDPTVKAGAHLSLEHSRPLEDALRPFVIQLGQLPDQAAILANPDLAPYRHFLERQFMVAAHRLSAPEETVAAAFDGPAAERWSDLTSGLVSKETAALTVDGKTAERTLPELLSLTTHHDKEVRREAGAILTALFAKYRDVAEAEMNALLAYKQADDQLRHFDTPEASRYLSDDISPEVVEAMCTAVEESFPVAHRFYQLKARLLGQPKIAYYERGVISDTPTPTYPYPEAAALVRKVFQQEDAEFATIFDRLTAQGSIDVAPRPGKDSGAFCAHGLHQDPTYILLNHTGILNDVLTLAHELGHAINNELCRAAQNPLNFGTPTSTAEVASTFTEDFVLAELLATATPEVKLHLLVQKLNDEVSTIFRQVAFFRFEQELHRQFRERGHVSGEEIGLLFTKHLGAYLGPAVTLEDAADWWVYIGHFRRFFYVYSYASGLLISKALQQQVRTDPTAITKVKKFLATGLAAAPAEIFRDLGLDITNPDFWRAGLGEVAATLDTVEQLATELGYTKGDK